MKYSNSVTKLLFSLFLLSINTGIKAQKKESVFISSKTKLVSARLNASIKTSAVPSQNTNSAFRITDAQDLRVFPSGNNQVTSHISINKQTPNNLLVSCEVSGTSGQGLGNFYSSDGGLTWNGSENNPSSAGKPHTEFTATSNKIFRTTQSIAQYEFQSSINGGVVWNPFNIPAPYVNIVDYPVEPNITVDNSPTSSYINNIYTVFHLENSNTGFVEGVLLQKSTNNGLTWNGGVYPQYAGLGGGYATGGNVKTGPNGEVYACWSRRSQALPIASEGMGFNRSIDGGQNFSLTGYAGITYSGIKNSVGNAYPYGVNPLFNNITVNDWPTMAVDKSNMPKRGRIYVTSAIKENGNGKAVVQVSYSDNKGDTWSIPKVISIAAGRQNWDPFITVDDCTGEVWVIYYSFDTPTGFITNTYVAHSTDGINWDNQKISDVSHVTAPINNALFPSAQGYAGFYISIAAYGGKAYPVWSDNRNGTWQLYCSPVTAFSINGNSPMCLNNSEIYSLTSFGPTATTIWSASVPQITLLQNGQSCTATSNGFIGTYTLTATVITGCGNTIVVTKQIQVVGNAPTLGTIQATWTQNGITSPLANCNLITEGVDNCPGCTIGDYSAIGSGTVLNPSASTITWSVIAGCSGYAILGGGTGNSFILTCFNNSEFKI